MYFLSRFINGLVHSELVHTYKSSKSTVTELEQEQQAGAKTRGFINYHATSDLAEPEKPSNESKKQTKQP
jgi:butyrate kinase